MEKKILKQLFSSNENTDCMDVFRHILHRLTFCGVFVALFSINGLGQSIALPVQSGLRLWLDARDADGDGVQEGLGESVLSGNVLNEWKDKSSCGNHFVPYSANKASYSSSAFGNRGAMVFANSTAMEEIRTQGVVGNTSAYTVFVAVKLNSTANQCIIGTNNSGYIHLQYGGVSNGFRMMHNSLSVLTTGSLSNFVVTSPHLITGKYAAGEAENNLIRTLPLLVPITVLLCPFSVPSTRIKLFSASPAAYFPVIRSCQ